MKIGEPIDLQASSTHRRDDGQERVARKVRRSILIYLYREEKVVEGPTLRSCTARAAEILADRACAMAMKERGGQKRGSIGEGASARPRRFREIAAA